MSAATSPVSSSKSDIESKQKRPSDKPQFLGSTRSNLELLTGIVRNKTTTTLNNNINFVSFCDGIAIVRTRKLVFSMGKSPQSRHRDAAYNKIIFTNRNTPRQR